jgi:hypothetical protein
LQSTVCLKRGDAVLREALCSRGEQPCSAGWSGCRRSATGFAPSIGAGLCHGDLIGDNLLRDRGGRLWPVDWDAAALAPRELYVSLFTAGGSRGFSTAASATPADPPLDATRSPSSCFAATSTTWLTGY